MARAMCLSFFIVVLIVVLIVVRAPIFFTLSLVRTTLIPGFALFARPLRSVT